MVTMFVVPSVVQIRVVLFVFFIRILPYKKKTPVMILTFKSKECRWEGNHYSYIGYLNIIKNGVKYMEKGEAKWNNKNWKVWLKRCWTVWKENTCDCKSHPRLFSLASSCTPKPTLSHTKFPCIDMQSTPIYEDG